MESILYANVARVFAKTDAFSAAIARNRPRRAFCMQTWQGISPKRILSMPRLQKIGPGGRCVCKRGKGFRQNGRFLCRDCTKSAMESILSANVARGGRDTLLLHAYAGDNISSIRTGNSNGIGRIRTGIGINSIRFTTASPPRVAVMGPKGGTMTAKNALNAVMGPKNGTMAARKNCDAPIFCRPHRPLSKCHLPSGHQAIKPSGHQAIKPSGHQAIKPSEHQGIRASGYQGIKLSSHQAIKPSSQSKKPGHSPGTSAEARAS